MKRLTSLFVLLILLVAGAATSAHADKPRNPRVSFSAELTKFSAESPKRKYYQKFSFSVFANGLPKDAPVAITFFATTAAGNIVNRELTLSPTDTTVFEVNGKEVFYADLFEGELTIDYQNNVGIIFPPQVGCLLKSQGGTFMQMQHQLLPTDE